MKFLNLLYSILGVRNSTSPKTTRLMVVTPLHDDDVMTRAAKQIEPALPVPLSKPVGFLDHFRRQPPAQPTIRTFKRRGQTVAYERPCGEVVTLRVVSGKVCRRRNNGQKVDSLLVSNGHSEFYRPTASLS
ncbi:MAG: hypothetical protein KGJ89_00380 [Patescibacteria group bacterium]|nr:hypothetical protein [Patescibacteria group bacterium]MDE2014977.1 hypothetical protein [Patescibacteria group bacterium]MDE2226406.1 hypothetical protein [Patescibacteria group bacterium]